MLGNNSWRSNKHNEKKTENELTQNMVKKMYRWKRMPMHIDEWIEFKWRILVWLEYFEQYKKLKNSNIKSKKLQKLIIEVQKTKSKKKETKSVLHAEKHRMCTQKIRKSKYTQK